MKLNKLLTTLALAWIVLLAGCKKDDYVAVPGVCPVVTSTSPVNIATNVPINQVITATFNEKMNPASINQASFTLQGSSNVAGTVTYNGANATISFTPIGLLAANTTYTGTIAPTVKDMMGNFLQTSYIWTFSTGSTLSPMVVITDPANNSTGVVLNKIVTATFNMPMDPTTINSTTFTLNQGIGKQSTTPVAGTVSYNGTTASFTPAANLVANVIYTGTITTGAKNLAGTAIQSNYVWTFTSGSTLAPVVISTDPANNATGVALNKIVTATFSMPMYPSTFNTTTFNIRQGAVVVPGTVSYSGVTASFTPSGNLLPGITYTATVTTGTRNPAGTALASNYAWTFSTISSSSPTIISTDPANNAANVPLNKIVSATFSTPMDPLTITSTTFTLKQGATPIPGAVTYSGSTASFAPTSPLLPGSIYTGTITTGTKNIAGTPLANNYIWNFTTGSTIAPTVISTDPANNATNVALNKILSATFNTAMDPLTITTSTFTLNQGTNPISGAVSYSLATASFTPTTNLSPGLSYTATITTGAKNIAGTPLANNYTWNFSTGAVSGPIAPNLNSVSRFGIIAGVGVSNDAGPSIINNMDVGIYPGVRSSITGFPPAKIVNGAIYASDDVSPPGVASMLNQAKLDLVAAYNYAAGATSPAPATVSGDLGGKTLAPGIYKTTSTLAIQNGDLTLDGQGNPNAVWIFQIASGFTTVGGAGGNIILTGGAQANNVYWQVGSSATIGGYTIFYGNVLALTSITMGAYAVATGRMLAINSAVTMTSTNVINKP